MMHLTYQMQDVAGSPGLERSLRLPVDANIGTPGAFTTVGTCQLRSGGPARPGLMHARFDREVSRAITNGTGRPVTLSGSRDHHVA
jgi:hypothetical protein